MPLQDVAPPPPPPAPPAPALPVADVVVQTGEATASAVYEGLINQRKELRNQLERLEDQRRDLRNELRSEELTGAERPGLETRLKETDARILGVEQLIAEADLAVAKAAAVPGAVVPPPPPPRQSGPPDEVFMIPIVFTIFVLMPIAVAYARRIWKKSSVAPAPLPPAFLDRIDQMGQAMDSMAEEVERIGEGQRFLTRVMSDQGRQLGQGAAQPIPVPAYTRETAERAE
ncbi:hypothetical protein [Gemmatimonas sp. UBA7669]|uniref:hypothetical protein n=1 Tax=Gemmatimonas sp. UBA7669 TaxID=1946568 RepID=UPI0025BFCE8A|nr:hypothetical protein [Gemmatimonas sp. UBA7669]